MNEVEKYIRSIPDFPEPGIIFRDITTVTRSKGIKDCYRFNVGQD